MPELSVHEILARALSGAPQARISPEEALFLLRNAPLDELSAAAHEIKARRHGADVVGYTLFQVVNYTNVCRIGCTFCSFCRMGEDADHWTLTPSQLRAKGLGAKSRGARQIFLQGGVNPAFGLEEAEEALRLFAGELGMEVRGFSPAELLGFAETSGLPLETVLRRLKAAGLSSVPGAGAEVLSDRVRAILSPRKPSAAEWLRAMEACHREGLRGTANVVFGSVETDEEIVGHLRLVRELQDRTGGFYSFVAWTFQPQTRNFPIRDVPPEEYLRTIALCRLFFDNVDHVEVSLLGMGPELGLRALRGGGDDVNSVVLEENVLRSRAPTTIGGMEELLRGAGFVPRFRAFDFSDMERPAGVP